MKHNKKTIAEFVDKGDWDGLVIELASFFQELRQLKQNDSSGVVIRTPEGAFIKIDVVLGETDK